jgi:hypothetical protein
MKLPGIVAFALTSALSITASAGGIVLDNDYFQVSRDETRCGHADTDGCAQRVIIALSDLELPSASAARRLSRGDIAMFGADESYQAPARGAYLEVAIKPRHPVPRAAGENIPATKNALLYDGEEIFVFEERLEVGDTRERHAHGPRLVVQLNATRLRQWPDGAPEKVVETVPETPIFAPAVIHRVSNIGAQPLRGIIIEFKTRS